MKVQPRKYLLNPVQREAHPMRGETHWGQPTAAVDRRYQTYRDALKDNIHRCTMKLYHKHGPSAMIRQKLDRLALDEAHALQVINFCHKMASAPRKLVQG